ncbi:MAG: peptide deformylase [Candidatus Hydrothermales bacterium]
MKKVLEIRYYGDPILRKRTRPVRKITQEIKDLVSQMIDTMEFHEGAGLAANQVGEDLSIFVVSEKVVGKEKGPLVVINPEIINIKGQIIMEEGCLSIPGIYAEVERAEFVDLKYVNLKGEDKVLKANGLLARVILHEYDHLKGFLFIDRVDRDTRRILIARYRKNIELEKGRIKV